MMTTTSVIRAFIAIDMTPEIRQGLDQVSTQLQRQLDKAPVRWVPAENIHLTLKFLGDVSISNLEMLKKILENETASHHAFDISVGRVGAFPSARQPRVIWVGVEAPPELMTVQRGIESAMERLGYAREERPFTAHLTLGRVSRNATSHDIHAICAALDSTKVGFLGAERVDRIHLYRSDLKPSGAVYNRVYTALLNTNP